MIIGGVILCSSAAVAAWAVYSATLPHTDGPQLAQSVKTTKTRIRHKTPVPTPPAPVAPAPAQPRQTSAPSAKTITLPHTARSVTELLSQLQTLRGKTIMFGQQHPLSESITARRTHKPTSDVKAIAGKHPAMFGFDLNEEPVEPGRTTTENGKALGAAFRQATGLGAVITISDHWGNPATGGEATDTTPVSVRRLLDGGDLNHTLRTRLDTLVIAAHHARRQDGSKIPIIYRPLHEHTGDWFWWGKGNLSVNEYRQLWQYIVRYVRQRTDNIAFAYSPNGHFAGHDHPDSVYLEAYPGDEYVDIMGYDVYQSSSDITDTEWVRRTVRDLAMVNRLAKQHGKLSALCEFGLNNERVIQPRHNKNIHFFTPLIKAIQAHPEARQISYMMTWANWGIDEEGKFQAYTPYPGHEMAPDFYQFARRIMLSPLR